MINNFIPYVINKTLKKKKFDHNLIYKSLLRETDISEVDAMDTTKQVVRILIGADLKIITSPMIREIVNTVLLQKGLEINRLQYTRIGIPFFDMQKIYNDYISDKLLTLENMHNIIASRVDKEYVDVSNLIQKLKSNEDEK